MTRLPPGFRYRPAVDPAGKAVIAAEYAGGIEHRNHSISNPRFRRAEKPPSNRSCPFHGVQRKGNQLEFHISHRLTPSGPRPNHGG